MRPDNKSRHQRHRAFGLDQNRRLVFGIIARGEDKSEMGELIYGTQPIRSSEPLRRR
jgi:hypothetical protein